MNTTNGRNPSPGRADGWKVALIVLGLCSPVALGASPAPATSPGPRERQPVALAVARSDDRLYVANAKSGSLSIINLLTAKVVAEHDVGRGLSDLATLPDGRILAVDRAAGALLLIDVSGDSIRVAGRIDVASDPVSVVTDGSSCVVASLWSRRLTFVDVSARGLLSTGTLPLPFSPRNMVLVGGGKNLVVADAFGGKLVVMDRSSRTLGQVRSLAAHNIRGLAVAPDGRSLVVAHQVLRRAAKTDFEDVHWGRLLTSHLQSLRLDAVLTAGTDEDLIKDGCQIDLGFATSGAGDPSALVCDKSGLVAVSLGGVNEIALGGSPSGFFRRYGVGARPAALATAPDGKMVYVADSFDDSISVISAATGRRVRVIALGRRPEPTLAGRGERLFYDARLSHDGWMSCHSCHTDGHSNGLLGDTLGDGSYGAPKRIPSLLGTATTGPWSWNGSVAKLEDQILKSVTFTMRGTAPSPEQVEALTAYVRSLSPPAVESIAPRDAVERGKTVFRSLGCADCHAPPTYTTPGRYDVGLVDEAGNREFNPPSLRGVGARASLLHDGRAATLDEVFLKHNHPGDVELSRDEAADLIRFLKSL